MKPILIEVLPLHLVKGVDILHPLERLEKYRHDHAQLAALWRQAQLAIPSESTIAMGTGVVGAREEDPGTLALGLSLFAFNEIAGVIHALWDDGDELRDALWDDGDELRDGIEELIGYATIQDKECMVGAHAGAKTLKLLVLAGIFNSCRHCGKEVSAINHICASCADERGP